MKYFHTIFLCFTTFLLSAQKPSTFKEAINTTGEISITDSMLINYCTLKKTSLDPTVGKSFFKILYSGEKDPPVHDEYFIAGKITSHKNFDILLLCAKKTFKNNSNEWRAPINRLIAKELFFVLLDKEGNYKNKFPVSLNYERSNYFENTTLRKVSSWIYEDLTILQYVETGSDPANHIILPTEMKEKRRILGFSMEYHINDYGVFVAYPKFKSN